jgi:CheY-like chemotaxis protein
MALSIVVIDDSPAIQKVIKIAFSRLDAHLDAAPSVDEGVRLFKQKERDVVIMDAELAEKAAGHSRFKDCLGSTPVVVLLSSLDQNREAELRRNGFSHFIRKPFENRQIVAKIQEITGKTGSVRSQEPAQANSETAIASTNTNKLPPLPPTAASHDHNRPNRDSVGQAASPQVPPLPKVSLLEDEFDVVDPQVQTQAQPQRQPSPEPQRPYLDGARSAVEPQVDFLTHQDPMPRVVLNDQQTKGRRAFDSWVNEEKGRVSLDKPQAEARRMESPKVAESIRTVEPKIMPWDFDLSEKKDSPAPSVHEKAIREAVTERAGASSIDREELRQLIQQEVADYCRDHFPVVAREVIQQELRKLAEEKSRFLMDL